MKRTRENKKRRTWKTERKRIESRLHPCPRIEGVEIRHEHRGAYIVFTPWIGAPKAERREFRVPRTAVLATGDFYAEYHEELARLARTDKEAAS